MKIMNKKGSVFFIIGLCLFLAAGGFTAYNFIEASSAEKNAYQAGSVIEEEISRAIVEQEDYTRYEEVQYFPDYVLDPDMEMPVTEVDGREYVGLIEIPALELKLPVLSDCNWTLLKKAPCRYSGSAYLGNLVIGAHNYTSFFSRLKELDLGHEVIFYDVDGNRFDYFVSSLETLTPDKVEEMKTGDWDLTLFTCTPGGQYRVTVRCTLSK